MNREVSLWSSLVLVLFTLGCGKQASNETSNQALAIDGWQPSDELLDKLNAESSLRGYRIRLPRDYVGIQPPNVPPGMTMEAFVGHRRSDGTNPMIQIMITTPPDDGEEVELTQFMTVMLAGVERRRTNWSQTPFEEGDLNGLKCIRCRWSGTDKENNQKMHGVMIAVVDGKTFIQLHTQDVEPHHVEALPIGEASALTFRKP